MKIVIIGAGNVASSLAKELHRQSFTILQVYSRSMQSAQTLANLVQASATDSLDTVAKDADLYVFSIPDSVLSSISSQLKTTGGLRIHTAGSMPLDTLSTDLGDWGVLYPFQTFSKGRDVDWKNIPIFIEASTKSSLEALHEVASKLSQKVSYLSSDKRKYIHLTGVFANNFVNHMYTLSAKILKGIDLPFDVTIPLIDETCSKIHSIEPMNAQTGPAIRMDENVIQKHLSLIDDANIREIYRSISDNIHTTHKLKD